jgi:hypothetical protein
MSRKCIRGVRRHLRRHQHTSAEPAILDSERVARYGVDYAKIGIAPWYNHQRPPRDSRCAWVTRLVTDFYRWRDVLAREHPAFYLAVWLFEPHFGATGSFRALPTRDLPPGTGTCRAFGG